MTIRIFCTSYPSILRHSWRLVLISLLLSGCTTLPQTRALKVCPECQLLILQGQSRWPLVAYLKSGSGHPSEGVLHVYLEGDGNPWTRHGPRDNPNSQQLVALHLMSLDQQTSLYLNRPCYGYPSPPPACTLDLWTKERYGERVVASLDGAITEAKEMLGADQIVLLGHSGGGSLAMLLAQRRKDVTAVVTLAANLDHRRWTESMGYSPLTDSLNPVDYPPLPESVVRWHYAAGKDRQVPPNVVAQAAAQDPHARYTLKAHYDHSCCWAQLWPDLLHQLSIRLREKH